MYRWGKAALTFHRRMIRQTRGGAGGGWTAIQRINREIVYLLVQLENRRLHVPVIMATGARHGGSVSPHDEHSG